MRKHHQPWAVPLTGVLLLGAAASAKAEPLYLNSTNRVTLSARFGLNIRAKFSGIGQPAGAINGYLDGYVATANPPNLSPNPNYSTYWGYDNASQLVPAGGGLYSGVTFHQAALAAGTAPVSDGNERPNPGIELTYDRELAQWEDWHDLRLGVEGAVNYLNLATRDNSLFGASLASVTYNFPVAVPQPGGGVLPYADNNTPGQSALQVPGAPGAYAATIFAQDHFDADLWGARLGPYLELPLTRNFDLRLSGGLAVGLLNGNESWTQTITPSGGSPVNMSGGGDAFKTLWGYYASLAADWQINKRWAVDGAVQFQDLGKFKHNFGGRQVELDLNRSLFLELGISYSF